MVQNSTELSIDPKEVAQFSRIADEWWDMNGKFKPLHQMNPVRIEYLRQQILDNFNLENKTQTPFDGLSIVDIGCGGGLISEPMARLGGNVTGLDASEENIKVAQTHADKSGLNINYICSSAEKLSEQGNKYDVVLALEIIEHVADIGVFMEAICSLLKPNGLLIMSTMNRTFKSYAMAIIGAEYIMRWLPRGTHDWRKFQRPSELDAHARLHDLQLKNLTGMVFNPFSKNWKLTQKDVDVNYLISFSCKVESD